MDKGICDMAGKTARDRMSVAIRAWIDSLKDYPGWKEWQEERIGFTLYFDDPFQEQKYETITEFTFSDDIERQRTIILRYLRLLKTLDLIKECEYYFRRYPFRDLPVTRASHVANICEMYLSRIYEFKERLKKYLNDLNKVAPNHNINISYFINLFKLVFEEELKARNISHHHRRFENIEIDRIYLHYITNDDLTENPEIKKLVKQAYLSEYRRVTNGWVNQVRRSGAMLDEFLEAVALATLSNCDFLSKFLKNN